jgi:hypothetical protein
MAGVEATARMTTPTAREENESGNLINMECLLDGIIQDFSSRIKP